MAKRYIDRRDFLKTTLTVGAGVALAPSLGVCGANERINVAVIGTGGQGRNLFNRFNGIANVSVIAVSDADENRMGRFNDVIKHQDYRRILDMEEVDAVVLATPNHWHAAGTIAACQAGKHVYVEKPLTHCMWEGRKMIEAARKYNRIVQAGTQQRSCPSTKAAGEDIRAGRYGRIKWIHCMQLSVRNSIGMVDEPQDVPEHIDYNLWAGPAPMSPVMRQRFHYDWHWQWNWGDGEMGNWGVHYLDDLCNILDWNTAPTSIISGGGRFVWKDNGETPNMHFSLMEHSGIPIVAEVRNLPLSTEREAPAVYLGRRGGNIIQCENGVVQIARGGGAAHDHDGNQIERYRGDGGGRHLQNFVAALRSGNPEDVPAPVEGGVLSSQICQQANIAYRMGGPVSLDELRERMKVHEDALNTVEEVAKQVENNDGNLSLLQLGPKLTFDPETDRFTGQHAEKANEYLRYEMRPEFAIPENV